MSWRLQPTSLRNRPPGRGVTMIGEEGIRPELRRAACADEYSRADYCGGAGSPITYAKLSRLARRPERPKTDRRNRIGPFPSETGLKTGAEHPAALRPPQTLPGVNRKPETASWEWRWPRVGSCAPTTAIIGDALYKDDAGGQKGGLFTIPAAKRRHRGCQLTESAPDRVWCNADTPPCTVPAGLSQARQPTLARAPRQGLTNHNHAEKLLLTGLSR